MPNTYFAFKTFTIQQQLAAMKVTTEACLFGAWVNKKIQPQTINTILDIGAGTGLLSLLLAQQNTAAITAIEIDDDAFLQSTENVIHNKATQQITLVHDNIIAYALKQTAQYNCIISNPPFYQQQLHSLQEKRNKALHDSSLNFVELFTAVQQLLAPNGIFFVLIPFYRLAETLALAKNHQLFAKTICTIQQTPTHASFRAFIAFTWVNTEVQTESITIKNVEGSYSNEFINLLHPFYLHL